MRARHTLDCVCEDADAQDGSGEVSCVRIKMPASIMSCDTLNEVGIFIAVFLLLLSARDAAFIHRVRDRNRNRNRNSDQTEPISIISMMLW